MCINAGKSSSDNLNPWKIFLYEEEEETADLEPCPKIDCCWRQHVTVVTSIFNISFQTIHILFALILQTKAAGRIKNKVRY